MMPRCLSVFLLLSAASSAPAVVAQTVPTPRQHFGFDVGEDRKLADWNQLTAYYEKLALSSPRVRVDTIGRTTKDRPFVMLTITSAANQARLAELQDIQLRLADPRRVSGETELERLLDAGRTVVLITHSIHSTEVGGAQMAARLAWKLAASDEPRIREILDNVILLDIPSLNPDGTQWINEWYNRWVGTDFEGTAPPWLYQFYIGHDNNRDWYAFTQKETQAAITGAHNAWHPQIVHDLHQMGGNAARIFFPPYIDPVEPNVDPAIVAALNQLGTYMAAELTAQGKPGVVVNASYDGWTPARAYQHYHGGVRILSETASARLATPVELESSSIRGGRNYDASRASWNFPLPWRGGRWGLPDIVDYMESGALALLTNAAKNRRFWLENYYRINRRAVNGWESWPDAWVIPAAQANPTGLSYVLRILTLGDLEVQRASAPFSANGRQVGAGDYVIRMSQPWASFAQTMLEVQKYPDLREYPGGPPQRPYDVTAHTLPLLMDVDAFPLESLPTDARLSASIPVQDLTLELPSALRGPDAPRIGYYKSWRESIPSGWTRWTLDSHGLVYDTIKDTRIRAGNLRRDYDVIVLQAQSPDAIMNGNREGSLPVEYTGGLGEPGAAALRGFVEQGGRLVTVEEATEFAIDLFSLGVANAVDGLAPQDYYVPGSILGIDLDTADPLARSLRSTASVWFGQSSRAFDVRDPGIRVVARYAAGNPLRSGWLLGPEHLAGKPALLEAAFGQGSVVLFGFQPDYRGQTVATWPLLFNALMVRRGR